MNESAAPYALPDTIEPQLAPVRKYWENLRRAENDMPFWDDVSTTALPDGASRLMLIDVFDKPMRFRFSFVGEEIERGFGTDMRGKFIDEMELRGPLHYLNSQCSATVEGRKPTYYRYVPEQSAGHSAAPFARLFLPLWGDGHISMLLGAIVWN